MKNENIAKKILIPVLAAAYGLLVSGIAGIPLKSKSFVLSENLLSMLIQLIVAAFTIFFCIKIMPKIFSNCSSYKAQFPKFSVVLALLVIVPFVIILKYDLIYYVFIFAPDKNAEIFPFVCESLSENLIESIPAVLLAPVIEELSFRYMAISPFKKTSSKIFAFILITLLFGVFHVRNFLSATIDAAIFGIAFMATKNIIYPIIIHAFTNLIATIFGILSTYNVTEIKYIKTPVVLIFEEKAHIIFGILCLTGVIIMCFSLKNRKSKI